MQKTAPTFRCIKTGIVVLLLMMAGPASGQLNKVYANFNGGLRYTMDVGLNATFFRYMSVAAYTGRSEPRVGPRYEAGFLKFNRLKNQYQSTSLLIGVNTGVKQFFNASFLLGPSLMNSTEYENISVQKNPNTNFQYATYDRIRRKEVGLLLRGDILLSPTRFFGINAGFQYHINPARRMFVFHVGLNFGLLWDRHDE